MTIPEATQLEVDVGKPIKLVDLALDLIPLSWLVEDWDIEIVFTGFRSGERLPEELLETHERRLSTPPPKIFIAQHRLCSLD